MKDSDFKNAKCNITKGFTKRACLVHSFGSTSLFANVPNLKCYDECFSLKCFDWQNSFKTFATQMFWQH